MGYSTSFDGYFSLNAFLKPEHKAYLQRFSEIRHLVLDEDRLKAYPDPLREAVRLPIGKHGMYFTGLIEAEEIGEDFLVDYAFSFGIIEAISSLEVQRTNENVWAPSYYCQWLPTSNYRGIKAEGDKFYGYIDWLRFIMDHFLIPWGYELSGTVSYRGEQGERGRIIVADNEISMVADGDSELSYSTESSEIEELNKTHWMTVGSVSDGAKQALLDAGGVVLHLHDDPPVELVGITYDCNYYKRFGHNDLAIWTTEGIELHSKNLHLAWSNNNFPEKLWEGFPRQRLILPGEPFDKFLPDEPYDKFLSDKPYNNESPLPIKNDVSSTLELFKHFLSDEE